MKRFLPSLLAFALALASAAAGAFFFPESGPALGLVAGLAVLSGVYALPADVVARIVWNLSVSTRRRHGMAGDLQVDAGEVRAELEKLGKAQREAKEQVQEIATKALKEAADAGKMAKETAEKADKALAEQGALLQEMNQKMDTLGKLEQSAGAKSAGQQTTDSDEFAAFVKSGGFKAVGQSLAVQIKALSGLTNAAGGVLVAPDRQDGIIRAPMRRMTVRDLVMPGRTSSSLIQFFRELVFTNSAATVVQLAAKPESNITFEQANAIVVTIAHWILASKQIIDDVPALQSFIDGRLRYGLMLVEEAQLLNGSGSGENLNGIYTQATAYALPTGAATPSQRIDTLRAMLLQSELAEYPATGIVINPIDGYNIEVLKTSEGSYLWTNPVNSNAPFRMWGRDVVQTQAMAQDTALVGAFQMGAQIFDREDANVVLSSEDSDNFRKNQITIRAEERLALAVYRPQAFVKNANLDGSV